MINVLQIVFIFLFILSTAAVLSIKPKIHNPIMVENQDFVITRISDNIESNKIPTVNIDVQNSEVNIKDIPQNTQVVQITDQQIQQNVVPQYVEPRQDSKNVKVVNVQTPKQNTEIKNVEDKSQLEMLEKIIKNIEQNKEEPLTGYVEPKPVKTQTKQCICKPQRVF